MAINRVPQGQVIALGELVTGSMDVELQMRATSAPIGQANKIATVAFLGKAIGVLYSLRALQTWSDIHDAGEAGGMRLPRE